MKTRSLFVPAVPAVLAVLIGASPAGALISGTSIVSMCGEAGNWIDLTFTADNGARLVDAYWNFTPTGVWLDRDGTSLCTPINHGVSGYSFYFDDPPGVDTQTFGLTPTGFDSGDQFRFVMDLDISGGGSPFTTDYYGATVRVTFSDGTILTATFNKPYDEPNGALATFSTAPPSLPDLAFDAKTGWYAPVVPRPAGDATWTSVPAPATLTGGAASTWFNAACRNVGDAQAGQTHMLLYVDGVATCDHALWYIDPGQYNGWYNDGPHTVRGGRHTVRATADALGAVSESDESNNHHARQWVWAPPAVNVDQVVTRAAPPAAAGDVQYIDGGWWYNSDGLRITPSASRPWSAVWMEALTDLDPNYWLRLHPASTGPENGFGTTHAQSLFEERLRAVFVNTRVAPQVPYDIGVLDSGGPGDGSDYRLGHIANSPYPFDFGIEPTTPYFGTRLLTFEFRVDTWDFGPASLTLWSDPADGPVHMGWLAPDFTYGNLASLRDRVTTDDRGFARLDLDLTQAGYCLAVVYGNRDEHPGNLAVNVGLYKARPDLKPATLTGWFAPVVPRPAGDAALFSCPVPDTLVGNAAATWLNAACMNVGTAEADTVSFLFDVDGFFLVGYRNFSTPLPAGLPRTLMNLTIDGTPYSVRGGRHALTVELDYLSELAELVERNNTCGRQYCWSPLPLAIGAPVTRSATSHRTGGWELCDDPDPLAYNCDGLRLAYADLDPNGWWRAVAVTPAAADGDVDLQLHPPLDGTRDGFGPTPLAASAWGAGAVDFVLVDYNNAPPHAYDVGVTDGPGNGVAGYTAEDVASAWLGNYPSGQFGPYTLAAGRMLHLYEMRLQAGTLLVRLDDLGAGLDWGISLYAAGDPYRAKSDAVAGGISWLAGPGGSESALLTVPAQGYYCLAVWKTGAADRARSGSYRLWFTNGATDVALPERPAATGLVGAAPNPFNPRTTLAFDLAAPGRCELSVHDLQGRLVRRLLAAELPAGRHEAVWDGRDTRGAPAPSGPYIARLRAGNVTRHLKLTLLK